MYFWSGGATYEQWNAEPSALHFFGQVDHFVEWWRNEPAQPNGVNILFNGSLNNDLRRNHDTEVYDLVIITGQNNADYIFADIVDVALDGCH